MKRFFLSLIKYISGGLLFWVVFAGAVVSVYGY